MEVRILNRSKAANGLRITPQVLEDIQVVGHRITQAVGDKKQNNLSDVPNIPYKE